MPDQYTLFDSKSPSSPNHPAPTHVQRAWMAGIFDGEGSLNYSFRSYRAGQGTNGGAWHLRVRISNTHRETIDTIAKIVGHGNRRTFPARAMQTRPVHEWAIESRSAAYFLGLIAPYCITKREQVRIALIADRLRRDAPRIPSGKGNGSAAPRLSPETHERLERYSQQIKALNGHKKWEAI